MAKQLQSWHPGGICSKACKQTNKRELQGTSLRKRDQASAILQSLPSIAHYNTVGEQLVRKLDHLQWGCDINLPCGSRSK